MWHSWEPILPALPGGYYLTSAYGALSLIKNFQEEQAARLLSSEARDTLRQWHKRRTTNRTIPSVDDFQVGTHLASLLYSTWAQDSAQMNHLVEKEQWSHPLTLLFHFCFFKHVKRRASAVDGPCPHWLHWNTRNALTVSNPSHTLTLKTSEWWWGGFLVPHCELVAHWQC